MAEEIIKDSIYEHDILKSAEKLSLVIDLELDKPIESNTFRVIEHMQSQGQGFTNLGDLSTALKLIGAAKLEQPDPRITIFVPEDEETLRDAILNFAGKSITGLAMVHMSAGERALKTAALATFVTEITQLKEAPSPFPVQ